MSISNLTNDISVDYTNYHPVFRFEAFLGIVISFTLLSTSKFHLVSLEIGLIFDNFNKPQPAKERPMSSACNRPAGPAKLWWGETYFFYYLINTSFFIHLVNI